MDVVDKEEEMVRAEVEEIEEHQDNLNKREVIRVSFEALSL